jgi:protein phosphatase
MGAVNFSVPRRLKELLMGSRLTTFRKMFAEFTKSMQCEVELVARGESAFFLPTFEGQTVAMLCQDVQAVFSKEPTVLELTGAYTIVGDLHGQILDLYRVVQAGGMPHMTKYLFLGDFVDRGSFSFEVVTFVFLVKILFPENVAVIRGNHEFEAVCETGGFGQELFSLFRNSLLLQYFLAAFSSMPLAAVFDRTLLAVHGGIGPSLASVHQLRGIERPITDFDGGILDSVLWSDPSDDIDGFKESARGTGFYFGKAVFIAFLERNQLQAVIRGHECVKNGYLTRFDGRLYTVFSASNYCGKVGNQAAILLKRATGQLDVVQFPPLPAFDRSTAAPAARSVSETKRILNKRPEIQQPKPHTQLAKSRKVPATMTSPMRKARL